MTLPQTVSCCPESQLGGRHPFARPLFRCSNIGYASKPGRISTYNRMHIRLALVLLQWFIFLKHLESCVGRMRHMASIWFCVHCFWAVSKTMKVHTSLTGGEHTNTGASEARDFTIHTYGGNASTPTTVRTRTTLDKLPAPEYHRRPVDNPQALTGRRLVDSSLAQTTCESDLLASLRTRRYRDWHRRSSARCEGCWSVRSGRTPQRQAGSDSRTAGSRRSVERASG